jgi:hypothetical protein
MCQLTLTFPRVEHGGVTLELGSREDGRRYIKNVYIKRDKISDTSSYSTPDKFLDDSGCLKSLYEIRHKQSVISLIPQLVLKWKGLLLIEIEDILQKIPRENRPISLQEVVHHIHHDIHRRINNPDNLFVGLKLENQAFGWLIRALSRYKDTLRDYPPIVLPIPHEYLGVFLCHESYASLSDQVFSKESHAFILTTTSYATLFERAHHDKQKEAFQSTSKSKLALYWLRREIAVAKLTPQKHKPAMPKALTVPVEHKLFFDQASQVVGLLRDCYSSSEGVLQLSTKEFGLVERITREHSSPNQNPARIRGTLSHQNVRHRQMAESVANSATNSQVLEMEPKRARFFLS